MSELKTTARPTVPASSTAGYASAYSHSISDPASFWAQKAKLLDWTRPFHTVKNTQFSGEVDIRWFEGGMLNVCYNCVDRHLAERGENNAFIFIPDDASEAPQYITYKQLYARVNRCANQLKALGVTAGDRVTIYMSMVPEAAIAMLACARIGAVHSVVFGGFSPHSLKSRIEDCASRFVITVDEGRRGGKTVALKANVDEAIRDLPVEHVLVLKHTGADVPMQTGRDVCWQTTASPASEECPAPAFDAEHPLFILYTSGSTGKPKGLLHTSAGYLLYSTYTFQTVFDYQPGDVYWCTADVGWITGHSYMIYGPLAAGATSVLYEGIPTHPDAGRFWQEIEKHRVNSFYTAPTAIRTLKRLGDEWVKRYDLSSLRILGSVGEPINPEAWQWYYDCVGAGQCSVVDTWWQTETGGHMITPLPGATNPKPGSATQPFFGIQPVLINEQGQQVNGEGEGALCIADSWPGQARTIWGDHARFIETYFTAYPGFYFSGDAARRDEEGDYWILGRMDDVLNVSGHRLGTAEIEAALMTHPAVAEAAVVGVAHEVKGEGIYAYVTIKPAFEGRDLSALAPELRQWVRTEIGPIASPDTIQFTANLPKTRSGKIMRRILRKIASGEIVSSADYEKLGDISTLLNPESVDELTAGKLKLLQN